MSNLIPLLSEHYYDQGLTLYLHPHHHDFGVSHALQVNSWLISQRCRGWLSA